MDLRMETKISAFNAAIETAAASLGLVFVRGPSNDTLVSGVSTALGETNGQLRGVYLFAVADGTEIGI